MSHGLVIGKFLPPHAGHHWLVDTALERCDRVTVVVLATRAEPIAPDLRRQWMAERHPQARVVWGWDEHPIAHLDPAVNELHAAVVRALIPEPIDVVFSSESYGPLFGGCLGARHVAVDPERRRHPVSGTAVRTDPAAHWHLLTPAVRAHYVRRIAVVGAESTGTTTLARELAAHFGTEWVPEYGRAFSDEKEDDWRDADFETIARRQQAAEDAAARRSGPLLFCDTDALATCIWQERYLGRSTPEVEALAASRRYDRYLLTDCDLPFVQDGTRDGEDLREWMTARFAERLAGRPEPWHWIRGASREDRLAAAIRAMG